MNKKRIIIWVTTVIAWVLSLIILTPFVFIILNSLKTLKEVNVMQLSFPSVPQWNNYITAIKDATLVRTFLNSLFISTMSTLVSVLASSMTAFVLSRRNTRMAKRIYYYYLIGLLAPYNIVTTVKVLQITGLMNKYTGIIVLYSALLIPASIFFFYGFIKTVPIEMDEAAIIDGCGSFTLFTQIVLPILKPVTVTIVVINFMNAWNDFILPLYILGDSNKWTMVLGIYNFFGLYVTKWNLIFADIVLTILPVFIIYIAGQRHIVSGMVAGAIKG